MGNVKMEMVEAVGVEPTSGELRSGASTCVAFTWCSRRDGKEEGFRRRDQSLRIRTKLGTRLVV